MGEYVGISIGNYDFLRRKNEFDDLLLIYSLDDLQTKTELDDEGEEYTRRYFKTTVKRAKMCLDVIGHTLKKAHSLFEYNKESEIEYLREDGQDKKASIIEKEFDFDKWAVAVQKYSVMKQGLKDISSLQMQ